MSRFTGDAAVLGVPNQFISQRLQPPTRAARNSRLNRLGSLVLNQSSPRKENCHHFPCHMVIRYAFGNPRDSTTPEHALARWARCPVVSSAVGSPAGERLADHVREIGLAIRL